MSLLITPHIRRLIDMALDEDDLGFDVTSSAFFGDETSRARLISRQPLVMAGEAVAEAVFRRVDARIEWTAHTMDATAVDEDTLMAEVRGPAASLLRAERVALNFLQRLCGVATWTAKHVDALDSQTIALVDTRKTLPGFRLLDKYAVRCGGGKNHRFTLGGGAMIKENHIAAAGGVARAIEKVRLQIPHTLRIEVEVERLDQIDAVLEGGADVIMLDNMDNPTMSRAVEMIRDHHRGKDVVIEASGNMTVERLKTLDGIGVDVVSVGALTHSAPAADISMRMDE